MSETILLIEDTENWRETITFILEDECYKVVCVDGRQVAQKAQEAMHQHQIDAVIINLNLYSNSPILDGTGYRVLEYIEQHRSELPRIVLSTIEKPAKIVELYEKYHVKHVALKDEFSGIALIQAIHGVLNKNESEIEIISERDPEQIDMGLIIALEEEFNELFSQVEVKTEFISEENQYYYFFEKPSGDGQRPYRCVAVFMGSMGPTDSGIKSERLLARFKPRTLINVGIAGGLDDDVEVGDVVVAELIDEYLNAAKAVSNETENGFVFELSGNPHESSARFTEHSKNLKYSASHEFNKWIVSCQETLHELVSKEDLRQLIDEKAIRENVKLHTGHIASGPIVGGTEHFTEWLKDRDRKYIALEMEAAGVMASSHTREIDVLIIRGISDYGNERKKKLDKIGKGALRRYAMRNALDLLWLLMRLNLI